MQLSLHSDRDEDATDRLISIVDTDARTGHKSDMRKIHGYKDHIMMDEETEIITAIKMTPANAEDGDQLVDLVAQFQDNQGFCPKSSLQTKVTGSAKIFVFFKRITL